VEELEPVGVCCGWRTPFEKMKHFEKLLLTTWRKRTISKTGKDIYRKIV